MNQKRRKVIKSIVSNLNECSQMIEGVLGEEQDALANMPENLEASSKYEAIEEAVDNIESAYDSLNDAIDYLNSAV